ncbi:MAG: DUF72 domain-containing protein [Acidobacteria bacterium]|nr:DUF72 domain-containing protein [Acidobacteriota bacterium]
MSGTVPTIRFGPAGWSYEDWHGIVYPASKSHGFHEAEYLARYFDTIEINTTFYHPPRPDVTRSWVRRVLHNPNFKFTAKLWQQFTHERAASQRDEKIFKEGIEPLRDAGRLGALLMQFPWSFKNTQENREYFGGLVMQFLEYPVVVEVRHESWNRPEVYHMFRELGVGFCNIDQPVIGRSLKPSDRSTSPVGYVRLHGRNYEHWFAANERPEERYDYYYSVEELQPWAERIRNIAAGADATYVITNNHFRGKAVANALQLITLIRNRPVPVPPTLIGEYPDLRAIAASETAEGAPEQRDLPFQAAAGKQQ